MYTIFEFWESNPDKIINEYTSDLSEFSENDRDLLLRGRVLINHGRCTMIFY